MKRLSPDGDIHQSFGQSEDQDIHHVFERFDFEALKLNVAFATNTHQHSNSSVTTGQCTRDTESRKDEGVGMANPNRIASVVGKIKANLPTSLQPWALSLMFNSQVKLAGTVGVRVEELTPRRSVVKITNARKAQNHIGGIHACGMALAAESATGILLGMSVPDSRMPLCKSMAVDFTKIAKGGVTAVATLTEEQLADIEGTEKGEAKIQVTVTDESGQEPIQAEFVWAWIPKRRKPKGG